ncbi:Stk1 family PASTA domain-containing Ser/Thr kinase [Streptomyces paromomycinus]|uniref:non-specific serine/threonine protein kinase n=1 Tax=Streptomyces paromomycinus TaxID=92743 RepID=A0A401W577_STREY|nr:Stk1 family PASTA domain-containing Ser/Thr kinase [Streptomyces paromomycinus]GCD44500.1 serine/threonine-protein kinase PksC [Streptomyces paromomycinus]
MSQDGAQNGYEGRSVGGGRYQLRDLLGAGGMASVHLAYDSVLDREVAIKTLHTELGREQAFRERFRREAQSVAKLTHTNIVSVFDSGEDTLDGGMVPYIVMEYVAGRPLRSDLDADIARHGAMPTEKALKITADVLAALEVSHEVGLVHRDIKPGNVMLNKRGVVKVMDFGIARAMQSGVTSMTQTGMVVGTPQYLSPEQALGRGVDARSDLYSVGIMLFELLTGRLPFDADSPLAIAYAHVQEEPPVPSGINRSLPPAVDALIARALKKNPNERFPTAEAMRDECLRVAGSGQSGATPLIISEGPRARTSGASVASAVFPTASPNAAGPHTPVPPSVQTPYQPTQAAPQAGPRMGPGPSAGGGAGFGPSAPSTPPPVNAYPGPGPGPMGASGPLGASGPVPSQGPIGASGPIPAQGPAPFNSGFQTPPPYAGPSTPAPVGPRPGGNRPGGRGNTPVIVVSAIIGVVVVTAIAIGIGLSGGSDNTNTRRTSPYTYSPSPSVKPEDPTATISTSRCTDPAKSYSQKGKIFLPSFYGKNLTSVKQCMDAAGWSYDISERSSSIYGKNTVVSQSPTTLWDPKGGEKIHLTVSTGRSS